MSVPQVGGYSVTAASHQTELALTALWPVSELPTRYPPSAAGVAAAMAAEVRSADTAT